MWCMMLPQTLESKIRKIRFDLSGYYFIGLVVLVLLGFWPTYFSKFFDRTADFTMYLDTNLFLSFKDLVILSTGYFIGVRYRHNVDLHARGMVVTGIVCIEPSVVRFLTHAVGDEALAFYMTISVVYAVLIGLIFLERRQKRGRWVFPLILCLYL